jgi:peptide/nickel transport system ATP-binding protein
LLQVSNLSVEYSSPSSSRDGGCVVAVDRANMTIPSSAYTLGLVGESGSGKTTLGMSLMRLIEPPGRIVGGTIDFLGQNVLAMSEKELLKFRWEQISMVHQSAMNSLNPVKPVGWHITEVIRAHQQVSASEAQDRTLKLLGQVGIKPERANDYPHEFSGGMRQRVEIAMALALSPKILVADEPTSALDVVVQKQILSLLKTEILQRNLSLIFITHEIALLRGLVENVAVMYRGEIVEKGSRKDVLLYPLHPYTEMLVSSLLTLDSGRDAVVGKRMGMESGGLVPKEGCRYANRCKYVFDRCRSERPLLKEAENGVMVACHKYN